MSQGWLRGVDVSHLLRREKIQEEQAPLICIFILRPYLLEIHSEICINYSCLRTALIYFRKKKKGSWNNISRMFIVEARLWVHEVSLYYYTFVYVCHFPQYYFLIKYVRGREKKMIPKCNVKFGMLCGNFQQNTGFSFKYLVNNWIPTLNWVDIGIVPKSQVSC